MKWFQVRPGYDPVKNKMVNMMVHRLLLIQRQTADWLNAKTKGISGRILLAALVIFCSLGSLLCLALILGKIK
ncbi:hypothetical protein DBR40_07070 [Pedobacter sp. KBW01]|nr:hypothetical protein DBR40_07070 [Pedobacter sp. KBW01]